MRHTFRRTEKADRARKVEGKATGCSAGECCVERVRLLLETVLGWRGHAFETAPQ